MRRSSIREIGLDFFLLEGSRKRLKTPWLQIASTLETRDCLTLRLIYTRYFKDSNIAERRDLKTS